MAVHINCAHQQCGQWAVDVVGLLGWIPPSEGASAMAYGPEITYRSAFLSYNSDTVQFTL